MWLKQEITLETVWVVDLTHAQLSGKEIPES